MAAPKPLLVILGETGSGKSALAEVLAKQFNGEIISADSWAVYKGFDIGTAKPDKSQQAEVPHHLIDIIAATEGFNAAQYQRLALQAIDDVHSRKKLPIMVGGTGLYIDSVIFNFSFLPVGDQSLRLTRNQQGISELISEANAANVNLTNIDVRNKRRIIRALEAQGKKPTAHHLRPGTLLLGIKVPGEQLKERIIRRTEAMIDNGLEHEVKVLSRRYGWEIEPLKGIGYAQWREYFDGTYNLDQTKERIINATLGLAKRQRTWFKRNKGIQWIDDPRSAVDIVTTFLNNTR